MAYQTLSDRIKPKHYGLILNTICITILFQAILMILDSYGIWFLAFPIGKTGNIIPGFLHIELGFNKFVTCGILSNINMAGIFLALGLPAFFRKKWCWFLPLIFWGIWIGKSLGGIIPAFVISLLFLFFRFKQHRWKIVSLTVLGMMILLLRPDIQYFITNGNIRFSPWGGIWKYIIVQKPIVGIGVGQFHEVFPLMQNHFSGIGKNFTLAHNEYLQLWAEQGIIGLGLAMGFIVSLFHKIPKTPIAGLAVLGIIAGLINCGVNFLFHTTGAMLLLIWVIILEKEKEIKNEEYIRS